MKFLPYLLLLTVNLSAQVTDVKHSFDNIYNSDGVVTVTEAPWIPHVESVDERVSDTTEVIYVVIEEDFYEQVKGNQVDTIYYPALKTFYGYHVQNWKPYNVVFYDLNWNIIQDPIHIKKRKLFKK